MKKDRWIGWKTYNNLTSIYVEAAMFQKAEGAVKEFAKRNISRDLSAYQFLIILCTKTGNLVEVYRISNRLSWLIHE